MFQEAKGLAILWLWLWKSLGRVRLFARVHGILQARILERAAFPFSRGTSQPRNWTRASRVAGENSTTEPPMHRSRGPQTLLNSLPDSPPQPHSWSPLLRPWPGGLLPLTLILPLPGSAGPIVPCQLFRWCTDSPKLWPQQHLNFEKWKAIFFFLQKGNNCTRRVEGNSPVGIGWWLYWQGIQVHFPARLQKWRNWAKRWAHEILKSYPTVWERVQVYIYAVSIPLPLKQTWGRFQHHLLNSSPVASFFNLQPISGSQRLLLKF